MIASACLFLAGKVEETPKPLSEVVTKTYIIRHNKEPKEAVQEKIKRKVSAAARPPARRTPHARERG